MRYVAAYLLAAMTATNPDIESIKNIIQSVGIDFDPEQAKKVMSQMKGKKIGNLIEAGSSRLASMPAGGAAGAAAVATSDSTKPADEPKDAGKSKKEEKEEESDDDMGFGLFD